MNPILQVSDLKVRRGNKEVVDVPVFSLDEGEIVSLIGPNGAGKSSFLLALASLIPFSGTLTFRGETIPSHRSTFYRRLITFVFQEPLLLNASVYYNVAIGLKLRGLKTKEINERVNETMEKFGIAHLADRNVRKLSGGEAQRVNLARAFAINPKIIFLDEPFSSLDPPTRDGLRDDLRHILKETGTAAIVATHDREDGLILSDRMAVMNEGRIIQIGPALEVMNRPSDEFIASFVGIETIIPGKVSACSEGIITVVTEEGAIIYAMGQWSVGEKVLCCIRPENVTIIADGKQERTSARNLLAGTIVELAERGFMSHVTINCGFPIKSYVSTPSAREMSLSVGKSVLVSFKATAVHVIKPA
ncbi:MAG: ABC transporter ATP-binding protein [Syntrophales bacterium]|nr:ABC transporter ATP-binding protein [Syntrophales bacterium]